MGSLSSWPLSSTAFLCAWQHYSTSVPVWIATCSGWWFTNQRADFGEIIHQSSGWWITDQRVLLSSYPCGEVLVIFDSFATYMRTVECIISFRQESWISNFQHVEYYIEYFISSSKFMIWVFSFVWHFFFGGSTYFCYLEFKEVNTVPVWPTVWYISDTGQYRCTVSDLSLFYIFNIYMLFVYL